MTAAAARLRRRHCPSWADLHPELVGLVLRRLPSLADRVRLGAVCRKWRRVARQEPLPPPLPWLTLPDGSFISIPSGEVHRTRVPKDAFVHGSVGRWLVLRRRLGKDGDLELMNPFSRRVVKLPRGANIYPTDSLLHKVVPLSTSPPELSSPDSFFAVLTTSTGCISEIAFGRRSGATEFVIRIPGGEIHDIAFCDGKLYALSTEELLALEIGLTCDLGEPGISSMECVSKSVKNSRIERSIDGKSYRCVYWTYLAECNGRLFRVRRLIGLLPDLSYIDRMKNTRTISFEILELDLTISSPYKWRRLESLGDQALFVGINTKFLPASECGAQRDCVYFVCDIEHGNWEADLFRDSGVFNMRDGTITPLLLDKPFVRPRGCGGCPTWFFPCC